MSARNDIWDFVPKHYPCLAAIARDIALGASQPPAPTPRAPTPSYPPLNFLANGEPPSSHPLGLAGLITHPTAAALAATKRSNSEGFQATTGAGLGIMFGTWSDYCLHCWAKHPTESGQSCVMILVRDHGPLNDILPPGTPGSNVLTPGSDWGETEQLRFYSSTDKSTLKLFNSLHRAANSSSMADVFKGNTTSQIELERLIAKRRVFVFNVWPWFRSGTQSTASYNMHGNLSCVREVKSTLAQLVNCLTPGRIAGLGSWSYDATLPTPDSWLRTKMFNQCLSASRVKFEVFRHPSARSSSPLRPPTGWSQGWQNPTAWGTGPRWQGKHNDDAFVDFIT